MNQDEPEPIIGLPADPPDHLGDLALKEWHRAGKILERMGVMTEADVAYFTEYCEAYAAMRDYTERIKKSGEVILTKHGQWQRNPYVAARREARKFCQQFWSDFGMTPSARSRVKVAKGKTSADKRRERFFGVPGGRR